MREPWDTNHQNHTKLANALLTEEAYLPSFFKFDEEQSQQGRAIEALIRVKYIVESGSENKDARQIDGAADSITFEELVAV